MPRCYWKRRIAHCGQKCFLPAGYRVFRPFQSSKKVKFRIRREFITTETELSAIAAAASIGCKAWKLKNEHMTLMNCCQKKKLKDKAPFSIILTFFVTPLSIVVGITGGLQFSQFENPLPLISAKMLTPIVPLSLHSQTIKMMLFFG